jgi:hypothetical protein
MEPTVTQTPPKSSQDFTLAHFLDRIGRNDAEGDGNAKVGSVREAAFQPDVAHLEPEILARPGLDASSDHLGELRPSLGKRVSRRLVRFLIVFSIGVGTTLAWQWYGDAARAMIATSWPQLASLAPEPSSAPPAIPQAASAAPQAMASPELQQLKEDLAELKQELQKLNETPAALASLRQSVDQLAGSQQQIAGTIATLVAQKPASPPRPAPAPKPLTPPSASKPLTPSQAETR